MINIKSKKGITIISLVITIIILLILSGTAIYNLNLSDGVGEYNNMVADINLLNDEILVYYNKYGEIPKTTRVWERNIEEVGNIKYYEVDLSKLEGITLNYGNGYGQPEELTEESDVYLINSNLHIYYLKGIKKDGEIYHFVSNNENYAPDIEDDIQEEETKLPEEYVELEYIESTGTQYIDTKIIPNVDLNGEFNVMTSDGGYAFGSTNGQNIDYWGINFSRYNNNALVPYYGTGSYPIISKWEKDTIYNIKITDKKFYIDNNLIYDFDGSTNTFNFNTNKSIYLFGLNYGNGAYHAFRFYSASFWNSEENIAIFIPCYSKTTVINVDGEICEAGTIGLYNVVEQKFYTNHGTGEFIAGPEV